MKDEFRGVPLIVGRIFFINDQAFISGTDSFGSLTKEWRLRTFA